MKIFITDNPQTNMESIVNRVFIKDDCIWIRDARENGDDCTAVELFHAICKDHQCLLETVPYSKDTDAEDHGEIMFECACNGCPVAIAHYAVIQAAALREELKIEKEKA